MQIRCIGNNTTLGEIMVANGTLQMKLSKSRTCSISLQKTQELQQRFA